MREHYGVLNKAICDQHGAVVKTIGDAVMATFSQPVDAMGAGLEMLKELRQLNRASQRGDLILKIGIHRGAHDTLQQLGLHDELVQHRR